MSKGAILIVEDEAIVAADLRNKLRQLGYEVIGVASTGEEALSLAHRLRPNLVLMDIWLQGTMDGIATAGAIREQVDIPVVYLTSHSDPTTLARAKITGPFGFILKPFEERELVTQIELALYKSQTDREIRQQREWLRVTLVSIGEAVLATDHAGLITFTNTAAEKLTGWTSEQAAGRLVTDVLRMVDEQSGVPVESQVEQVLSEGRTVTLTDNSVLPRGGGDAIPVAYNAAPIRDLDGQVIGAVLVVRDVTLRKRAEYTMREANARYELVMAGAKAAIWDWDVLGNKVMYSPQWKLMRGMAPDDLSDSLDEWRQNIHPDDADRVLAAVESHFAGHTPVFTEEYRVRHKDGTWIWISDRGLAGRNEHGQVLRMAGSQIDITEHKRDEERLAQKNRQMAVANRIIEMFFRDGSDLALRRTSAELREEVGSESCEFGIVDESGTVVYPSTSALLLGEGGNGEGAGDVDRVCPALGQHSPPTKQVVVRSTLASGDVQHSLTVPIVFQEQVIGLWLLAKLNEEFSGDDCLFLDDVAQRTAPVLYAWLQKRMRERERKRAEERWRLLAEINAQLLASDRPHQVVEAICRQVMEHLDCEMFLNVLVNEQSGRVRLNSCAGISPEVARRIGELDYCAAVCRHSACDTCRKVSRDIPCDSSNSANLVHALAVRAFVCHPLVNQGHVIGSLAFGSRTRPAFAADEINLLKAVADHVAIAVQRDRLLDSLERSAQAANAANDTKSQFLANMSHELRTPMNAILGMVDVALPKATQPTVTDCLQTIKDSADLLLTLLNDLLDSSKIESGKMELDTAPFSLRDVLQHVTHVLSMRASEKGLAFACHVSADVPDALIGDRMRLQQILLNLAGNAIKFTERGGVTIRLHADGRGDDVYLEFAVEDTGIGIPSATLTQIFQPFVQADATMARRFGGSGLGLAISKKLAHIMGGDIQAESRLGEGSTFYFTVQLKRSHVPIGDVTPSPLGLLPTAGRSLRILLVEDNPANRKLVRYVLVDRGHVVDQAEDGAEAIRMAEQNTYDAILMDVQMPGMDGLEATAAIRQLDGVRGRVPIVALTAHAMAGDRARCLASGMDGYLAKPINAQSLLGVVEGVAERSVLGWANLVEPATSRVPSSPDTMDVFDPHEALGMCLNNEKMLRDMMRSFLNEIEGLLSEMRAALSANDLVRVGHLGHRVKSTAVYLGAHDATEAAAGVEQFCVTHDRTVADAKIAVNRLQTACRGLADALVKHSCWLEERPDCETAGALGTPDN